ncbi:hypothetical protein Tsubulata_000974 [Turnera subulata]|uniref:DUF4283 domain-containing protein n=1 Tax=Turnera subulata TaxID=218843 RepID=A0A9Q0FD38_9ROSI|nr:hypothetical protein Tsubulata_000974 [Turnera subulata]
MAAAASPTAVAAPVTSTEELDQQERSNKKVKCTGMSGIDFSKLIPLEERLFPDEPRRKESYKFMLTGQSSEAEMTEPDRKDWDGFLFEDSDPEDEDEEDPFCPTIRLSSADKRRIYQRWKQTLIIKLLGKKDYDRVLYDGPWIVADHVLTVRKWQPRFDPDEAIIDRAILWVQIPKALS